jgi:hypothetical protein
MRSALKLAIEKDDIVQVLKLCSPPFSPEIIAFDVRFAKTSKRMRHDAVYYAVYKVFDDHRNGKDTAPALLSLKHVASGTEFEPDDQLLDFITKDAYYHANGTYATELGLHISCWQTVVCFRFRHSWPYTKIINYAIAHTHDLFLGTNFNLNDGDQCAQRTHADGIWLQIILFKWRDQADYSSMYDLIVQSIVRNDEEKLLQFILREMCPPYDLRSSIYSAMAKTVLHACVQSPDLKPYQLNLLLQTFNPLLLDHNDMRPSDLLLAAPPHEHTDEFLTMLRASEEIHEPSRRDLMVVMGHSLLKSGSILSCLDNELLRMIIEYAQIEYSLSRRMDDMDLTGV